MPLDWFAEPYQPYGSFSGEGTRRVLGKPELDPLAVLIRETGQNAWDAKRDGTTSVDFSITGWTIHPNQLQALRDEVFAHRPPAGLPLNAVLDADRVEVLCISDRGTRGLAGPTRADQPAHGRTDFIDYVFNMGQPRDIVSGGGTYGFGKTITYVASKAAAVVVHTRTEAEHHLESRIIGIAVGSQYEDGHRRFTGRHWWGVIDGSLVQPVTGAAADGLAARLGLPGFALTETGTDIMIVAPNFGGRSSLRGMQYMAEAALWHFWPKTIPTPMGDVPMRFQFTWEGEPIALPIVGTFPPLDAFAHAFRGVRAFQHGTSVPEDVVIRTIESLRPRRRLGVLGIVRVPRRPRISLGWSGAGEEEDGSPAPFSGNSHHVALMRQVNLVVNYRPGPELPLADVEWAGVFINEPDIDSAFAEAEPPTHDEWKPAMVADKAQKQRVNTALRNIDAELRLEFGQPPAAGLSHAERSPVVVADALGGLLASTLGTGPQRRDTNGSGAERRGGQLPSRRAAVVDVASRLVLHRGARCTLTRFRVEAPDRAAVTVSAAVHVAIDGGTAEREPPLGSSMPSIVGWAPADSLDVGHLEPGPQVTVPAGDRRVWAVVIRNPASAALSIALTANAER